MINSLDTASLRGASVRDEAISASVKGIASQNTLAMTREERLPAEGGCYVLILRLTHVRSITVGRLGKVLFPRGTYLYVGSASGAGGLRARVGRHLRGAGKVHWHIDYLRRAVTDVCGCLYTVTDRPLECEWGHALAALPHATIPVPHFGSSDCRSGCRSHLIALPLGADLIAIRYTLAGAADMEIDPVLID